MRNFFLKGLLFLLPITVLQCFEDEYAPEDQLLVIFGSSGYILYKVLDFANDHGFRYLKILSYEFTGFDLQVTGTYKGDRSQGRFFELQDDNATIAFICFEKKPDDPYIIDLEKYRSLLEQVDLD